MMSDNRRLRSTQLAIRRGLKELDAEIERHRSGSGRVGELRQLEKFRSQLLAMDREVLEGEISGHCLGMGRAIADSWPLDSALGGSLIAAEQAYRDLLR